MKNDPESSPWAAQGIKFNKLNFSKYIEYWFLHVNTKNPRMQVQSKEDRICMKRFKFSLMMNWILV